MIPMLNGLLRSRRRVRWLAALALALPLALQLAFPSTTGLTSFPGIGAALGFGGAIILCLGAWLLSTLLAGTGGETGHD